MSVNMTDDVVMKHYAGKFQPVANNLKSQIMRHILWLYIAKCKVWRFELFLVYVNIIKLTTRVLVAVISECRFEPRSVSSPEPSHNSAQCICT